MDTLNSHIERYFKQRTPQGNGVLVDLLSPQTPNDGDVVVNHNDYLCVGSLPEVAKVQVDFLEGRNQSPIQNLAVMSGVFMNEESFLRQTEMAFARYMGYTDAMIGQSGYDVNSGLMQCLCNAKLPIYLDKGAHASFFIGITPKNLKSWNHNDLKDLVMNIEKFGPGVIVVDSVYSSIGDVCALKELCSIKEKYNCILCVDESHSLGMYGFEGRGFVNMLNVTKQVDIITASLAKAFASRAGILATNLPKLSAFVRENAFPSIFSTALLPLEVCRLVELLKQIIGANASRLRLNQLSTNLRNECTLAKIPMFPSSIPTPIIAVVCKGEAEVRRLNSHLVKNGVHASVFCAPAAPLDQPIMRITLHANLKDQDILTIVKALKSFPWIKSNL